MIELRTGTRVRIVAGVTDLRRGFTGLSAMVQTTLERVFRNDGGAATEDHPTPWTLVLWLFNLVSWKGACFTCKVFF